MAEQKHKPDTDHYSIPALEALLRTRMGDDLIVENYSATDLLAPGENYGSLLLTVDAVISRKEKDSKPEELHMVAKLPPLTKWQRDLFDSPNSFKKEIFMYETILPTYKELERKCGITEEDVFDMGPAYYGSRLNLELGDIFDDNAVILLENLKYRGYYVGNRYTGMDLHHSRVVVKTLARFHALGIATKTKNPDFFRVLKLRSKSISRITPEGTEEILKAMYRFIKEDPVMGEHYEACAKALDNNPFHAVATDAPEDPWSTIIHCDLWINNIFFHRDEASGLLDDVKIIDFQDYLMLSALRELNFVLALVGDEEVTAKHVPELIDLYYDTFVFRLETMGCDLSPYSRDQFDEQLAKDAWHEFTHVVHMIQLSTWTVDPNSSKSRNPSLDIIHSVSDDFYARTRAYVSGCVKRGWV